MLGKSETSLRILRYRSCIHRNTYAYIIICSKLNLGFVTITTINHTHEVAPTYIIGSLLYG